MRTYLTLSVAADGGGFSRMLWHDVVGKLKKRERSRLCLAQGRASVRADTKVQGGAGFVLVG